MKFLITALFIVATATIVNAQEKPSAIADEICHCLDSLKNLTFKERSDSCFIKTYVKTVVKDKKMPGTVEGITGRLNDIKKQTYQYCPDYRQGYNEETSKVYDKLSANKEANNLYSSGTNKLHAKDYDGAITDLEKAVKLDKDFLYAIDHLAICYRQKNDYDTALKYYKRSLEIFPAGNLSNLNTAVVYGLKKDYKTSLTYYEKLKFYYPKDAEGYFGSSKMLLINGDYEASADNIFTAYHIYQDTNSPYLADCNTVIKVLYNQMKAQNSTDLFEKKAKEYNINVNIKN